MAALAVSIGASSPALAAANDGFAAFWKTFAAAAGKDDKAALATMVTLGPNLGDNGKAYTFDQMHAAYLKPAERRCLAKAKPERTADATGGAFYSTNCGDLIYVFNKTGAAWTLTDLSPND
ncbi:MAG TPA: hypothetical protein VII42_02250 [Caulobacteraceae bacterium]